ncbi:MAG: TonB-dependent receptor [Porticoccaceae bacterium]
MNKKMIAGGFATLMLAPAVAAQEPSIRSAGGAKSSGIEEIIVTAQRRSQNLLDTPMSIAAATGEALESAGVVDTLSLSMVTPGLVVGSSAVYAQTYLRGIGNDSTTPGTESSVAVYVDGVYRAQLISGLQTFVNLERVEVLKGPQGTLYGRNALGGAINIVTRDIERNEMHLDTAFTVGNKGRREARFYASSPLGERAGASLGAMTSRSDGFVTNLFDGSRLEEDDYYALQARFTFDVSERTNLLISADRFERDDTRGTAYGQGSAVPLAAVLPQASMLAQAFPEGSLARAQLEGVADRAARFTNEPWQVHNDAPAMNKTVDQGISVKLTHDFDVLQFTSISSYRDLNFEGLFDADASSRPIFTFGARDQVGRQFMQDFQLVSTLGDSPYSWIAGAMYIEDHSGYQNIRQIFPVLGVLMAGVPEVQVDGQIDTEAVAVYAQGSYDFNESLRATLGVRYSDEKKTMLRADTILPLFGMTFPTPGVPDARRWDAFTPHFSLEYRLANDILLYGLIDRGFKSGTYNITDTTGANAVNPEKITAYQAGLKGRFFEHRVAAEFAAFYYDYSDLQAQVPDPNSGVTKLQNAASATLYGLDASLQAALSDRFGLQVSAALLHARYDDYIGLSQEPDLLNGGNEAVSRDFSDNDMVRAPRYTLSASLDYRLPLSTGATIKFNLNGFYSSSYYFDPANRVEQGGYTLLNARLSYLFAKGFSVAGWGRNLTDKAVLSSHNPFAMGDAWQWNEPRTYGVTLQYSF